MNAMQRAEHAYTANSIPIKSESQIEYEAFARISRNLKLTAKRKKEDYSSFVSALTENRNLWRILAIDVADEANALPNHLRAQIFYLAEFTNAHTREVLNNNAPIEPLTEINLAIMRGLSSKENIS